MYDKWKKLKLVGGIIVAIAVVAFLVSNIRFKSVDDYRTQFESGGSIVQETLRQDIGEQSLESEVGKSTTAQQESINKKSITVSIEIRCDSAVNIRDSVKNPGVQEKIPTDGSILAVTAYDVEEGTSVYDLLAMTAAKHGITITANTDKSYVSSINNLSQMMLSQYSGWKYSVNGKVSGIAAKNYILKEGDTVKWFYVLSLNEGE